MAAYALARCATALESSVCQVTTSALTDTTSRLVLSQRSDSAIRGVCLIRWSACRTTPYPFATRLALGRELPEGWTEPAPQSEPLAESRSRDEAVGFCPHPIEGDRRRQRLLIRLRRC